LLVDCYQFPAIPVGTYCIALQQNFALGWVRNRHAGKGSKHPTPDVEA